MARRVSIQNDAISEVACQVFLAQGYHASTAEIARRAGVSEGSIFKRFKTKRALFLTAMDVQSRDQEWQERLMAGVGKAPVGPTLKAYGLHLLERLRIVIPRILMVRLSGVRCLAVRPGSRPLVQYVAILARYLRAEAHCGRLRLAKPEIQADLFVGALSHYVVCEMLFGHRTTSQDAYIRTLVDNNVRELRPTGLASVSAGRPRHSAHDSQANRRPRQQAIRGGQRHESRANP